MIAVQFRKVVQTQAYTAIIIGTDEKQIAIYTDPSVGEFLQKKLTGETHPRPLTCDLIDMILKGFEIKVLQIVINHFEDTVYFARIFLEQTTGEQKQIVEIDARPSDCLILALLNQTPLYCQADLFEKAIAVID